MNVVIIDYGLGNILSVQRAIEYLGASVLVTNNPKQIISASHVLLPGVGAFPDAMREIGKLGIVDAIREIAFSGKPLMGICLGMQLLMDESNEYIASPGLGLIAGQVIDIPKYDLSQSPHKIPHIGWSRLIKTKSTESWAGTVLQDTALNDFAYFVHSYMAVPLDPKNRLANCDYGGHEIAAVIAKDNIVGCQFHPEKSGEVGLKILNRFLKL